MSLQKFSSKVIHQARHGGGSEKNEKVHGITVMVKDSTYADIGIIAEALGVPRRTVLADLIKNCSKTLRNVAASIEGRNIKPDAPSIKSIRAFAAKKKKAAK